MDDIDINFIHVPFVSASYWSGLQRIQSILKELFIEGPAWDTTSL